MVVHEERFGRPFAFVVAGTDSDRIDAPAIRFHLRMHLRVTINLARACLQNASAAAFGDAEHVDRSQHTRLHRFDRVVLVVSRRSGARHVVDLIDFEKDRQRDVVTNQFKIRLVQQVSHIGLLARKEIVQANDVVALLDQTFAEVGTKKPAPPVTRIR